MRIDKFFEEAITELHRANDLHGPMHSSHEAYATIKEELDEFWDDVKKKKPIEANAQDRLRRNMKKELIQIAAMCCRTVIDLNLDELA